MYLAGFAGSNTELVSREETDLLVREQIDRLILIRDGRCISSLYDISYIFISDTVWSNTVNIEFDMSTRAASNDYLDNR